MSKAIQLPWGGTAFHLGSDEEAAEAERVIRARAEFTLAYCRERGWPQNVDKLSFAQIFEIRDQPGWKEPKV